jgi:hypothetical protein
MGNHIETFSFGFEPLDTRCFRYSQNYQNFTLYLNHQFRLYMKTSEVCSLQERLTHASLRLFGGRGMQDGLGFALLNEVLPTNGTRRAELLSAKN